MALFRLPSFLSAYANLDLMDQATHSQNNFTVESQSSSLNNGHPETAQLPDSDYKQKE